MEELQQTNKLDFKTKFFYGFGSISFGIKNNGFSYFVLFVYSSVLGLPAWMAGLALNLVLIADAITDPLVGYFSDRTRSRWGRRHPFMYAAALPVAITYYFLWTPPESLTDWELFSYLLFCAIIIRVFITFYEVPSVSLGPELTDNYVERTSLMSFRYFFGWFGGLTTYNLVWFWFGPSNVTETISDGRFNPIRKHGQSMDLLLPFLYLLALLSQPQVLISIYLILLNLLKGKTTLSLKF